MANQNIKNAILWAEAAAFDLGPEGEILTDLERVNIAALDHATARNIDAIAHRLADAVADLDAALTAATDGTREAMHGTAGTLEKGAN